MKKNKFYVAKFTQEDNSYIVEFLDFEEGMVTTYADTIEEAYYLAQDRLYLEYESLGELPEPDLNKLYTHVKENEFLTLIELDIEEFSKINSTKTVNTTVTMPEWLKLKAEAKNINFSQLLQEALKTKIM